MNLKGKISITLIGLLVTAFSFGQTAKPTEYLGVPGPISFDKISYNLVWTSHPADNYYKQEYLAKGDTLEKFQKLIMLEIITGKTKLKDIVAMYPIGQPAVAHKYNDPYFCMTKK